MLFALWLVGWGGRYGALVDGGHSTTNNNTTTTMYSDINEDRYWAAVDRCTIIDSINGQHPLFWISLQTATWLTRYGGWWYGGGSGRSTDHGPSENQQWKHNDHESWWWCTIYVYSIWAYTGERNAPVPLPGRRNIQKLFSLNPTHTRTLLQVAHASTYQYIFAILEHTKCLFIFI